MFLLSTIENRVRQNLKNLFFCGRKYFEKKSGIFFWKFFKHRKIEIQKMCWNFLDFFRNFEFWFFLKKIFFSKIFFDHKKLKFFGEIFFKFISCVRKIVLKWFQNDSDSLKIRKIKDQKYWTEIKGSVVIRAVTLDRTMVYNWHCTSWWRPMTFPKSYKSA